VRLLTAALCLTLLGGLLPPGEVLAAALSPYCAVEMLEDGTTVYTNRDGSKTVVFEAEGIPEEKAVAGADRLIEEDGVLVGADHTVDVRIDASYTEDTELVHIEKDGMAIAFTPIPADTQNTGPAQEEGREGSGETVPEETLPAETIEESTEGLPVETAAERKEAAGIEESSEELSPSTEERTAAEGQAETPSVSAGAEPAGTVSAAESAGFVSAEASAAETATETSTDGKTVPAASTTASASSTTASEESAGEEASASPSARPEDLLGEREEEQTAVIAGKKQGGADGSYEAVEYPDLFGRLTCVRLSARTDGIKEEILLDAYEANPVFTYDLRTANLTLRQDGQRILLVDAEGNEAGEISAPFLLDAAGRTARRSESCCWTLAGERTV